MINEELDIELEEAVAEGTYTNFTVISHSPAEFVFDFIRLQPGITRGSVKSRIVMSPEQAKRLLASLSENVSHYENLFGEIQFTPMDNELSPMPFCVIGEA